MKNSICCVLDAVIPIGLVNGEMSKFYATNGTKQTCKNNIPLSFVA